MSGNFEKKKITKKTTDISRWYNDVVLQAGLADYGPTRGTMVIKPYGYAIWERIQKIFNKIIKKEGVENAYFPLFIPYSLLRKEKEHIKGFSPELALVTYGGGKELKEPLVVRPTSETIIYQKFAEWIKSWRDLPLKINQWCNVVRWELRTYLFLRTTEFLWQEGHTAHASYKEANQMAKTALGWYQKIYEKYFAINPITGFKSETEKFAGAQKTYTVEVLIPGGKVLQGGTSHNLGQNFSKPFKIIFQDKNGATNYVWQTSWGMSTRALGGLILVHGDDQGLVLPPKIAPLQIIIIPIFSSQQNNKKILEFCKKLKEKLEKDKLRVKIDDRKEYTPGYKFNEWELKGVPLRLEVGEKETRGGFIKAVRRDNNKISKFLTNNNLTEQIKEELKNIQESLFSKAQSFLKKNITNAEDWKEFKKIMESKKGFIRAFWCGSSKCEERIKQETKATTRCLSFEEKKGEGKCIYCHKPASYRWFFGQSY